MTHFKTLLLLFAILHISQVYSHDCNHDDIEQNPELLDIEEDRSAFEEGRFLASTSYKNLRIYPYYGYVQSTASSSYANYIEKELFPPVVDYFEAALKVKSPVVGNLKLGSSVSKMCERSVPSILKSSGVAADIVIYIDTEAVSGTQIASSKYCYLASGTKRPIVTRIMLNRNMLKATSDVLVHEQNMYVLMHEVTHGLGFSNYQFPNFIDSNGKRKSGHIKSIKFGGKTHSVLDVAPLTAKLRAHYGCPTLQGAIMENGGGSSTDGSHFERRFFMYEYMASGSILGRRVSELSLALLEGSGWYVPDYNYAEPYHFGKGEGCSFMSGTCSSSKANFDEYCTGSNKGCTAHGRGGGKCSSDSIADGCRFVYPALSNDCENDNGAKSATLASLQTYGRGAGSKCFTGTLSSGSSSSTNSFCFKYNCVTSGSSTKLEVIIGGKAHTCSAKGTMKVSGYNGAVNCPDPKEFCSTVGVRYCPRNCMGRGTCVDSKCQCKSGYKGVDCALKA